MYKYFIFATLSVAVSFAIGFMVADIYSFISVIS